MTPQFTRRFRVRHYELDVTGRVLVATYVRYMQEAAIEASAAVGFDTDWYRAHETGWVIRGLARQPRRLRAVARPGPPGRPARGRPPAGRRRVAVARGLRRRVPGPRPRRRRDRHRQPGDGDEPAAAGVAAGGAERRRGKAA